MSGFFQTGAIATPHGLGRPKVAWLEQELEKFPKELNEAVRLDNGA
jgi:hypothetical protein